jgi:ribA/ribD-fused uncharacterized protein
MGKERDYIIHDENNIKGFFGEYRWLSNFHETPVIFEGVIYPSTENAYQAAKCLDLSQKEQFVTCAPSEAKKLSKSITIRENWDSFKYDIMSFVVFDKFYRDYELRLKLLETDNKYIEETNHWNDTYWGFCNGRGQNKLGKIIMGIRTIWKSK